MFGPITQPKRKASCNPLRRKLYRVDGTNKGSGNPSLTPYIFPKKQVTSPVLMCKSCLSFGMGRRILIFLIIRYCYICCIHVWDVSSDILVVFWQIKVLLLKQIPLKINSPRNLHVNIEYNNYPKFWNSKTDICRFLMQLWGEKGGSMSIFPCHKVNI